MKSILQRPLNIVALWWSVWGALAYFSLTGLYPPSGQTYIVLALFVVSLLAGGILPFKFHKFSFESSTSEEIVNKKISILFKTSAITFFVILLVLVIKSCYQIQHSFTPTVYRSYAFSTMTTEGTLFSNRVLENIYFLVSSPVLFFLALCGLVDFWKNGKFLKLVIAFVINAMDAYIRLGRVNLYLMIILFLIIFIVSDYKIITFLKTKKKQVSLLLVAFACIFYIGVQRGYSPSQQFKMFVIDYHTVGFSLFDHEIKNKASPLNTITTYGRLTFGGLETMVTILIRQFDRTYYSPALKNSIRMAKESIVVGVENPPTVIFNGVKAYNSFYTLLYTFFSDGGYLGVILGGAFLGFILEFCFKRWQNNRSTLDAISTVLILSIGVLSIFMSQLEIMRTWILILFLIYLRFTSGILIQKK